ncbi:DUF2208 domain-containing protein [Acidianus sulfidivorans JP7]|uniref:DUF2208 domain-containing protein n=1 Tax=Acidianus sulfidivorans JP7 TaxID=619593 RepID=A0A2U9IMD3_9CREN|nr:DUF2208 domain-containing protein [Acidianus sulfidivorans]AWR97177.1 DUF2208 domain-containing protein [Acidianus sulfidivorans JP7]
MSAKGYNPYNWKMITLTQAWLIIISVVLTFYPKYYIEAFIAYFVIIMAISFSMMYKTNPMFRDRKLLYEIINSRTLYEEKDVTKLMMADKEFQKQYTAMVKKNFSMMGIYLIYIIVLLILYGHLISYADSFKSLYMRLLVYLIYFEALYGVGIFMYRKVLAPNAMMTVMAPPSYKINEKGIVSGKGASIFLHAKYLLDSDIIYVNKENHYVEIDSTKKNLPYKIRLYSNDVDKVMDYLERIKKLELKRQTSSQQ